MIELRGEHVVLRALEREHCHTLWEMTETAEDVPTEHVQLGLAQENADKWFEEVQGKQGQTGVDFGVFTLEGKVIGHVQLHSIDWQDRSAELGLGFARGIRSRQRVWHEREGNLQLIVSYAFDHLGLHRLAANPVAFNSPAIRVLEKCGFQLEGHQRDAFFFGGRWYDRVNYLDSWRRNSGNSQMSRQAAELPPN